MLEKPVRKFNWRKLRKEEREISLDAAITDSLMMNKKTKFIFHGILRPKFMRWGVMSYTIYYRIASLTQDKKFKVDSDLKRLVIPVESES